MGKLKNLLIDDELPQAHSTSFDAQPEQMVYVLMQDSKPMRVYTDKALAFYECWVCTKGCEYAENPSDYYITESTLDTSPYDNLTGE
jgi:hypothetical protein